jgi:hypothetical protein
MSESRHQDLVEEFSALILKQQLGILDYKEKTEIRSKLSRILKELGHEEAAEISLVLNKTDDQKAFLIKTINKVFPCSRSKKKKSSTVKDSL